MTTVADPITVTEVAASKITQLLDEERRNSTRKRSRMGVSACSCRVGVAPDSSTA